MVTLYWIYKYLTFPGALFHAFLEQLFCRIFKEPVEFNSYMQRNGLCGHIEHLLPEKKHSFSLIFWPHFIMLLMGLVIGFSGAVEVFYFGTLTLSGGISFYAGLSCLCNCFPLYEDAINMWTHLYRSEDSSKAAKILLAPSAAVMYAGAFLDQYALTLLTSLGTLWALPYVVALFL